jgi:hypothetical protein
MFGLIMIKHASTNFVASLLFSITGYESYKYKITNISYNHKNSHKITKIYKKSQEITKLFTIDFM